MGYQIDHQKLAAALQFPTEEIVDVVIDTDAYNEVDDQFAIAWALRSPERVNVEAVYAAPRPLARCWPRRDRSRPV